MGGDDLSVGLGNETRASSLRPPYKCLPLNAFELEKKNINTHIYGTSSIERPQKMAAVVISIEWLRTRSSGRWGQRAVRSQMEVVMAGLEPGFSNSEACILAPSTMTYCPVCAHFVPDPALDFICWSGWRESEKNWLN